MFSHGTQANDDLAGCKACHGSDLTGRKHAGNCLTCHPDGEPISLHPIPFIDPAVHGAEALRGQQRCFGCHGSTPNTFDGGALTSSSLYNSAKTDCSASGCHNNAGAHPTNWQGTNDTTLSYQASHRTISQEAISTSCALCHQVTAGGPQLRNDAPSCFASAFTNADGSTTGCHASGPGTAHAMPYDSADLHGAPAKSDLAACQACHGTPNSTRFDGGAVNISCQGCHVAAGAHPTRWQGGNDNTAGYQTSHRNAGRQSTTCAICHDVVQGNPSPNAAAPSCFASTFTNADGSTTGCHASGPGAPAHALPYTDAQIHGPDAKNNLSGCVSCHATPSDAGVGGNPRFNVAIGNLPNGCETCHANNSAHPTRWQGTNDLTMDFIATHRLATRDTIDNSCAMCHAVVQGNPSPNTVAPSCFASTFTNADGSTTGCHASGPGTAHAMPYSSADLHGAPAKSDLAACQACHGTPSSTRFDGGAVNISCQGCHVAAGAHPTRWQGDNDNTAGYQTSHRDAGRQSTTCAICHDVVQGNPSPNTAAPSCFASTFTNADGSTTGCHASGPGTATHPLPYTDPQLHGADAKKNLAVCVVCHATPTNAGVGGNPRFNVAIGSLPNGCETCHATRSAHPTPLWTGPAVTSHKTANLMDSTCALCHGTALDGPSGGGIGPACTSCHTAGSPLTLTDCTSCHSRPPNGQSPAGDQFPNRSGAHAVHNTLAGVTGNCETCHQNAGTNTDDHFSGANAASVSIASTYDAQSGVAGYDKSNQTCSTTRCHGGQTTPHWAGTLDVNTQCTSCHSTSSDEYNSSTSGDHSIHQHLSCTSCHDVSADHFSNLATTSFEGNPKTTIQAHVAYDGSSCGSNYCHGAEQW